MSNFRTRAKEIKAQGVEQRGNFTPSGAPLKMYKFWAANTNKAPKRENFCHFWRVVAIWAPLMFLRVKATQFLESRTGQVILSVLALGTLITSLVLFRDVRLGLLLVLGIILTAGVFVGIGLLIDNYWPRKWNKPIGKVLSKVALVVAVTAGTTAALFGLYSGITTFGWIFILWLLGGLAIGGGFIYGVACLSDYIMGIREEKAAKRREFLDSLSWEEFTEYMDSKTKVREPGKISKFFSGLADFIVLVAQIVRVKKWKICPMVTIESSNA